MNNSAYWYLIPCMLSFAGGEYFSKRWSVDPSWWSVVVLFLCYNIGTACWLPALRTAGSLTLLGSAWCVLGMCVTITVGLAVYGEQVSGHQVIGLLMGIASIILMSL